MPKRRREVVVCLLWDRAIGLAVVKTLGLVKVGPCLPLTPRFAVLVALQLDHHRLEVLFGVTFSPGSRIPGVVVGSMLFCRACS
jgi:hypothetical protein